MGAVYLAEQEHPIKRRVALKVIKPGMDSRRVIARFEAERQTLALLDHPNIAQIYDAGATESGRPYFVMEYVEGLPVTQYCDQHRLSIEERLGIFLQVCQAVQYAHQKGIIHRDIKASNILVSLHGDQAVPKVIDFGVAKAISQPLMEQTLFTEHGQLLGTPEYMSPEQADMANQDIDTRSDIYSLGVLLYVLLAGVLPFDSEKLRGGGLDHIRRVIREEDPKTPSARLSTISGDEATRLAGLRRTDPNLLRCKLKEELDWITAKAMEKKPQRRYETVNSLALDIRRHLNGEPILSRPMGRPAKLWRWCRRKPVIAALAFALILVSCLGLTGVLWQWRRALVEKSAALRNELTARRNAYAAYMGLVQQALEEGDLSQARPLLDRHRPLPGQVDLRGWEWRYRWQQCQRNPAFVRELLSHPAPITNVAISSDSRRLAAGARYGWTTVLDLASGRSQTIQDDTGARTIVTFVPQSSLLAFTWCDGKNPGRIRLWDVSAGKEVRSVESSGQVKAMAFSPDGTMLAASVMDETIMIWEPQNADRTTNFPAAVGTVTWDGRIAVSPLDGLLAIGEATGWIRLVELPDCQDVLRFQAHYENITALAFSPDGKILASGAGVSDSSVRLWDATNGQPLGPPLAGHTRHVHDLAFSLKNGILASASADQSIRLWDTLAGKELAILRGHDTEVWGVAFTPDGNNLISSCKDGSIWLWKAVAQTRQDPRMLHSGPIGHFAFLPDGKSLAAVKLSGSVCLWDTTELTETEALNALGTDNFMVAPSPDGRLLAVGDRNGRAKIWDWVERRVVRSTGRLAHTSLGLRQVLPRRCQAVHRNEKQPELAGRVGCRDVEAHRVLAGRQGDACVGRHLGRREVRGERFLGRYTGRLGCAAWP